MKRLLALLGAVLVLCGCRSASQSTNPFMRNTIPPPATGAAAPGGDYYQGGAPPQIVPGTPMESAPIPSTIPGNNYAPPGGSFNYQQSSIKRTKAVSPSGGEYRVGGTALARRSVASTSIAQDASATSNPSIAPAQTAPTTSAPTPAVARSATPDTTALTVAAPVTSVNEASNLSTLASRIDPSPLATTDSRHRIETAYNTSSIRIVDTGSNPSLAVAPMPATAPSEPIRLTVSGPTREITDLPSRGSSEIRRASYSAPATSDYPSGGTSQITRASFNEPISPSQAVSTPAGQSTAASAGAQSGHPTVLGGPVGYAYSTDYSILRGKLEYSLGSRQWKLRYIPIDGDTDKYGGSVVIADAGLLGGYKPGESVSVQGAISSKDGGSRGFSPRYIISRIDRAPL